MTARRRHRSLAKVIKSGIVTGLTAALYGQVTMTDGVFERRNCYANEMMEFADTAEFDIEIIANNNPIGVVGEPGTPAV
jgi:isoquinoline 1-oxidoreductase beta subunit